MIFALLAMKGKEGRREGIGKKEEVGGRWGVVLGVSIW